jgi:hypothetical protein
MAGRVELALRYTVRGRFDDAKSSIRFNARVYELFDPLRRGLDEPELPPDPLGR